MTVRAQGAVQSGTPTNANGGTLRLQGGLARQDGTTGLRGGVRLELSSGGDVMVEAAEVAVGRRVIALNRHSAITATEVPSGDGVVYIGNVLTFPTSSPVTGAILAVSSGVVYGYNAGSLVQTLNTSLATKALTDADYTTTVAEHTRTIMEFTGTLTANRNIVVPTVSGYQWTVYNNTTGGFSLTVKTNSGTGIAVAAGKRTIVYCDGTNVVRVTPDT
jgi:hypothetical protein